MKIGIVDIGTNTILLTIAKIDDEHRFTVSHDQATIVRLGEGIHSNQEFLPEAMDRGIKTLKDYQKIMEQQHCDHRVYVGTAACRNAKNFSEFVHKLKLADFTDEIQILSGEDEASLIHLATSKDFEHVSKPYLVLDIGGGSTEFILDDGKSIQAQSLPFGSVKLTEEFIKTDPPAPEELQALNDFVKEEIQKLPFADQLKKAELIATAGTPTTIYAIHSRLPKYDAAKVHAQKMSYEEFLVQYEKLIDIPINIRSIIPCLAPKRADVINAGAQVLKTVMDVFELKGFWISDRGLRYGVLHNQIAMMKAGQVSQQS